MTIHVNDATLSFHLTNNDVSYIFRVLEKSAQLEHLYYGEAVHHRSDFSHLIEREVRPSTNRFTGDHTSSFEHIKQEYPSYGTTDFRYPAFTIEQPNGSYITDFRYDSYRIIKGKPTLSGLPHTYVEREDEAETLIITLVDDVIDVTLELSYTIYTDRAVITRHSHFINNSIATYTLSEAQSLSIDFPDDNFEMVQLNGAWAREAHVGVSPLKKGVQSVSSNRGASGHVHNPFIALKRPHTTEQTGEVYGFSLVYSGNFRAQVEVDTYDVSRVSLGINPFHFAWQLTPGDSFTTPEAVMVYSQAGLSGMSQTFHDLYRKRLARGYWRDKTRPILINNWEATYFDFDEDKILTIAKSAKDLGIELFVLDDGWFGKRNDDATSLGDWFVDHDKLPNGISALSKKVTELGMRFGLWFEPEMISHGTKLYEDHPDWLLEAPDRSPSHGRNQYVLDFSRDEVIEHIYQLMTAVIDDSEISYIKWDMNRNITEAYSRTLQPQAQGEAFHRYILGVYKLYEKLTTRYPEILFESCAGGGGRFDPGLLYYAPQTWTSDDTDAVERLKIQYGTSMVYPLSAIGSHVSQIPNHQVGRSTPLQTRAEVAYFGTFGYELDVTELTAAEKETVKKQVTFFKRYRELISHGTFHRLLSPFESNETAWMVVSHDQSEALVGYYKVLAKPNEGYKRIKLTGLDKDCLYHVAPLNKEYYGSELMAYGIILADDFTDRANEYWGREHPGDYQSHIFTLTKK
ncbi:alpha-galactosidase [Halolactibacillus miurensis]|uniref:Alpha-galactosidase n=1 Tax=Halolactibacillus miurensis TaxID=306541 RepID=A0A1I6PCB7_9BACI|nr:alpha-galactosidase [Halolactibacillus miurensis]GEM05313.1 alpha-galactosidase [Halolactibacillus miurensis]SFS37813.1 alpha-galactosidase [Halolactibacillus miurensis]